MNHPIARLLLLFSLSFLVQHAAADWPHFRGPAADGTSAEKPLPTAWSQTHNLAWKIDLPGPGASTPLIVGDRIFITCYTGYNVPRQDPGSPEDLKRLVLCLDRKTGDKLWEIKLPSSVETTPITYMGADGRQFVTVVSTGGGLTGSEVTNDEIIAFALPRK